MSYFKKNDNGEKAYWLGFIAADGCVFKARDYNSYVFYFGIQERDSEMVLGLYQKVGGKVSLLKRKKEHHQNIVRLMNCSKELNLDLINLGIIPRKSLLYKFPSPEQVPKEFIFDFIRGYFDGDGCMHVKQREKSQATVASFVGTREFLLSLKRVLEERQIRVSALSPRKNNKAFSMRIGGIKSIHRLYNLFYNNKKLFLLRKKIKFEEAMKNTKRKLFVAFHEQNNTYYEAHGGMREFCRQFNVNFSYVQKCTRLGKIAKGWRVYFK